MGEESYKTVSENKDLSAFIQENFGSNATYVEGLLARYRSDPKLVDDAWQEYFGDLLSGKRPGDAVSTTPAASDKAVSSPAVSAAPKAPVVVPISGDVSPRPITGPAKKIVENMETSLTVPTATSFRTIPVKVLEENRRIINDHLANGLHGKVSFTHLIAWAIVTAIRSYPNMNVGFGVVDGVPSRLEHQDVNLGIAIDIEKKDGSRNLLVPNIKAADKMTFAGFFAAYNDQVKKARDGKLEIADFQGTTISLTNPGTIGTAAVVQSPPDGYTFAVVFDTHGVNPSLIPSLSYDTKRDLAAVSLMLAVVTGLAFVEARAIAEFHGGFEDVAGCLGGPVDLDLSIKGQRYGEDEVSKDDGRSRGDEGACDREVAAGCGPGFGRAGTGVDGEVARGRLPDGAADEPALHGEVSSGGRAGLHGE